jgi:hypothetical protein
MQEFYIGWHQPRNGRSGCGDFPRTMISVNRLLDRKSPFPVQRWILDSGAFTRIASGVGHLPIDRYAAEIVRWSDNGDLAAAVSQDYMCEQFILNITRSTVREHQELTVDRYDRLLKALGDCPTYLMPVLQGYSAAEYLNCLALYGDRLKHGAWVGIGSVCKRNANAGSIEAILLAIHTTRPDLRLHGFGIKQTALKSSLVWDLLYSADSQAHGFSGGSGSKKYVGSNNPAVAIEYANRIQPPTQLSIFRPTTHC